MLGRHFKRAKELEELARLHAPHSTKFLKNVDVVDFLESLEIENISRSTADEINFSCPFPGHTSGDATPSAYMNDGSIDDAKATYWKCFGCNRKGTAITFYAELEGISNREAARHLRERWGARYREPRGGSIAAEFNERLRKRYEIRNNLPFKQIDWEHYYKLFGVDWEEAYEQYKDRECSPIVSYMFKRGFTVPTLEDWEIGYDAFGRHGRFTIPIVHTDERLVGVKGRAWDPDARPKYKILGDRPDRYPRYKFRPYEKSRVVFGLHRVKNERRLVLCEGELDVIALAQCDVPAIATGSAHVSGDQARLIRDYADEIIVFFDSNTAGINATWGWRDQDGIWRPGLVQRLAPFLSVRVVSDHPHDASALVEKGRTRELLQLVRTAKSHLRFWA